MTSVLYVDDEPLLLELAKIFLERSGTISVTTVDSAAGALVLLQQRTFDVIVSDYQMPGMDGIAFLKTVREEDDEIPFILFTGRGREEVVVEALNSGASSYIQKGGHPTAQFVELEHRIRTNVEHRRARSALSESESKYRQLVENAQESIFVIQDERFVFTNPVFRAILENCGFSLEEFVRHPFYTFMHPEDQPLLRERHRRRIVDGENIPRYAFRIVRSDGAVRWMEIDALRVSWNGRPATLNFARDITEEHVLRERAMEIERRYADLVESLPMVVIELDERGNATFVNREGRRALGYPDPDATAREAVPEPIPTEEHTRLRALFQSARPQGMSVVQRVIVRHHDEILTPLEVFVVPIRIETPYRGLRLIAVPGLNNRTA
jgi:PAS domain S-box-containing protein